MEYRNYVNEKIEKRDKGKTIAIIIISVLLALAVAGLGVSGYFIYANHADKSSYKINLENMYQKSYYDLVSEITTMENDLYKFKVSSSKSMQIKLLDEIEKSAANSETNLSSLKLSGSTEATSKFFNQVGDYAKALSSKLSAGEELTDEEYNTMSNFAELTKNIGKQIASLQTYIINNDFTFMDSFELEVSPLTEIISEIENNTIEYPTLIYDGPFSDGLIDKEAKALSGEIISKEQGAQIIAEKLSFANVSDIVFQSVSTNYFNQLNYTANLNGQSTYISISERGGQFVEISSFKEVTDPVYTAEECAEAGRQFLEKMGYSDMEAVWASNSNSVVYVNYTVKKDDTIIYPDMIKLKITADDCSVIGFEALTYIFNHTEREFETPTITLDEAKAKLNPSLNVTGGRKALIPLDGGKEALCYEFIASLDDNTYYIYVSVKTGEELNILRVIDGDDGALLM